MVALVPLFLCVGTTLAFPFHIRRQAESAPFRWATIGDSWASSVAYSDSVTFDGNKDKCLRSKESYTYQMEQDSSWQSDTSELRIAACSGARLVDMALGQKQVEKTGEPRILLITAGGNDAGFAAVARDCIYQPQRDVDYQGEYPAPGLCRSAIEKASGIIDGLGEALQITYADIFKYYEGQPSDLNVYHTGYAHFFNTNSNWCNEKSFGAIPFRSANPKLSPELRTAMNDLVEKMNRQLENSVASFQSKLPVSQNKLVRRQKDLSDTGPVIPDPKEDTPPPAPEQPFQPPIEPVRAKRSLGFIDITRAFDGHRFCEDDSSFWKQYYGDSTWFWNLRAQLSRDEGGAETDDVPPLSDDEVSQLDQSGMSSGGGGGNEVGNGWRFRPFHPTQSGNTAVKSIIVERLRADGVPGVESIGSVVGGAIAGILSSGGKGA